MLDTLNESLSITCPRGDYIFRNSAHQTLTGIKPDQASILAHHPAKVSALDGTPLDPHDYPFRRALRGEIVRQQYLVMERPNGRSTTCLFSSGLLRSKRGGCDAVVIAALDTTTLLEVELTDRAHLRLRADLVERSPDLIARYDREFGYTYVNPAFEKATKIPRATLQGKTNEELGMPPDLIKMSNEALGKVFAGGLTEVISYEYPAGSGQVYESILVPDWAPDGTVASVMSIARNVTHHLETERVLRYQARQREDYLRALTHDLRSPLTVICAHAQVAAARVTDQARVLSSLAAIDRAAQQVSHMLDGLAFMAKLETEQLDLRPAELDLSGLVREVVVRHRLTEEGRRVGLAPGSPAVTVIADRYAVERVLDNLIANALKYSPAESAVEVAVDHGPSTAIVAVTNQGPPLGDQELAQVFDRYYRTEAARSAADGLGLGLYIAKTLVEAQAGSVWVECGEGQITFRFALPRQDAAGPDRP